MYDLQGKRVLVTGGTGFIGANLTRELVRCGAKVHVIVRNGAKFRRIDEIVPRIKLHTADLADGRKIRKVVQEVRPEIVFHLAAPGGHPFRPEEREEFLRNNILGTFNLLEAAAPLFELDRFVHLGSSTEYGPKNQPMKETDLLEPSSFRGVAKAAATLLCQQFARANHRPIVVLRPFSIYGYWESPARFVPTAIRAVLRNEELALTAPGYRHDFLFIEDLVEACLYAAQAPNVAGEIINLASGQQWDNEEVVEVIQEVACRKAKVRVGAYPAGAADTSYWVGDIYKAEKLLKWVPRHSLRSGLEKTISWFQLHPEFLS